MPRLIRAAVYAKLHELSEIYDEEHDEPLHTSDWWEELTEEAQKEYLLKHPNSRHKDNPYHLKNLRPNKMWNPDFKPRNPSTF